MSGRFRFQQNKKFVNSTFFGARRDTFSSSEYPTENLVGFWSNERITKNLTELVDFSDNQNNGVFKTGRAVRTTGQTTGLFVTSRVDFTKVGVYIRTSATSTLEINTAGSTQYPIVTDGEWHYFKGEFAPTKTILLRFLTDPFGEIGDFSEIKIYDSNNNLLDTIFLNNQEPGLSSNDLFPGSNEAIVSPLGAITIINNLELPVSQLATKKWNEYPRIINSEDTEISFLSFSNNFSNGYRVKLKFYLYNYSNGNRLFHIGGTALSQGAALTFTFPGQTITFSANGTSNTVSSEAFDVYKVNTLEYIYDGLTHFVYLNSVLVIQVNSVLTITAQNFYLFGEPGVSNQSPFGHIFNIEMYDENDALICNAKGYGNDPWGDISGNNNDGVQNTTVKLISNGVGNVDEFGNNFELPGPSSEVLSIPQGELIEIPDNAAYDSVQTVAGWYYHDGDDKTIVDLGTPAITVASDVLGSTGITAPVYYVNGSASTALSFGWNHISVTTGTGFNAGPIQLLAISAKWLLYSDQKDATAISDIASIDASTYS